MSAPRIELCDGGLGLGSGLGLGLRLAGDLFSHTYVCKTRLSGIRLNVGGRDLGLRLQFRVRARILPTTGRSKTKSMPRRGLAIARRLGWLLVGNELVRVGVRIRVRIEVGVRVRVRASRYSGSPNTHPSKHLGQLCPSLF